jgi:hypothetical protein
VQVNRGLASIRPQLGAQPAKRLSVIGKTPGAVHRAVPLDKNGGLFRLLIAVPVLAGCWQSLLGKRSRGAMIMRPEWSF